MSQQLPSVNRIVLDESFVKEAYENMPYDSRFPELMKMLAVGTGRLSNIQHEILNISYSRFLDNATGATLDGVASRFFIRRDDKSDNSLRQAIRLFAIRQHTEASRDDIVRLLKILAGEGGLLKINKLPKNNIQVIMSRDCLDLADISVEIEDLFPINCNLEFLAYSAANLTIKPFGLINVETEGQPLERDNVGSLASSADDLNETQGNRLASVIINSETQISKGATY